MTADGVSKSEEGEGEEELAIPVTSAPINPLQHLWGKTHETDTEQLISLTPLLSHSTHLTTPPNPTPRAQLSALPK